MKTSRFTLNTILYTMIFLMGTLGFVRMGQSADNAELARAAQNPIANMISLPLQNNTGFNVGPNDDVNNVFNIQPVIPFGMGENWNLITRTIAPVIYQPEMGPGASSKFGLGDINMSLFVSPAKAGKIMWGAGPVFSFPTASDELLGTEKWSIGPSVVVLTIDGPWVAGFTANNLWSFAGDDDRADVNGFLLQYFVNYNLSDGWYVSSAPIITANWEAESHNRWTVPFGGGVGKIFRIGKQPLNAQVQAFYNVISPDNGPDWSLRLQLQFLFPKG